MEGWKFDSSCEEGFHEIIAPGKADCEQEYIYRLNLSAGKSFDLETGKLEMDAVCIKVQLIFWTVCRPVISWIPLCSKAI